MIIDYTTILTYSVDDHYLRSDDFGKMILVLIILYIKHKLF